MLSEYEVFDLTTSSIADMDPARVRALTVDERRGHGASSEPSSERVRLQARLRDARKLLADALHSRRMAMDLIDHLKEQLSCPTE